MAKWAEIKCERCAEQDALWEGMERALEESDAREARLERWLAESETREETLNDRITMLEEHLCLTEEKLERAMRALEKLSTAQCFGNGEILGYDLSESPMGREVLARMEYARTTLAELKGHGDE